MHNPYDIHPWSKLYREAALKEAQVRHLEHWAKAHRRSRSVEQQERWPWLSKLAAAVGSS